MNSLIFGQKEPYNPQMDQNYQVALKVITILEEAGHRAQMAGGCVRDRMLGIQPKDYDVATDALPEIICSIFAQKSIRSVPTGIDHGTVTIVIGGVGIEVTTLRRDVDTDGRHAVVEFGISFEDDSLRRDFTINAMFENKQGQISDFHDGRKDLQLRVLRFVGNPETRIREDYLRILRLFRFWARFDFQPAPGTLEAVQKEVRGLEHVSQERKTNELLLTLECSRIGPVLKGMAETGCLTFLLGLKTFQDRPQAYWDALVLNTKAKTALARLASLLQDLENKEAQWSVIEGLRLSRNHMDAINILLDTQGPLPAEDPAVVYDWLDRMETTLWEGVWADFLLPIWRVIRPAAHLVVLDKTIRDNQMRRVSPVNGQFLIQTLRIKPGPELGDLLLILKNGYRRGQWTSKEQAVSFAKKFLKLP